MKKNSIVIVDLVDSKGKYNYKPHHMKIKSLERKEYDEYYLLYHNMLSDGNGGYRSTQSLDSYIRVFTLRNPPINLIVRKLIAEHYITNRHWNFSESDNFSIFIKSNDSSIVYELKKVT